MLGLMPAPHRPPDFYPAPRVVGDLRLCEYIVAECSSCGHCGDVVVTDLVERHGPWFPLAVLARRLRCTKCGGAARPPRVASRTPRRATYLTYHDWFRATRRQALSAIPPRGAPRRARP